MYFALFVSSCMRYDMETFYILLASCPFLGESTE